MTAYMFCIEIQWFEATVSTNLYGIILWQMETYFVNEKREIDKIYTAGRGYQDDDWWYPVSCCARAKENIFNILKQGGSIKLTWDFTIDV